MKRRSFLAGLSVGAALDAAGLRAADGEAGVKSTSNRPPRKVIVGTAMQAFWGPYPGLQNRLAQLAGIVDQMAAQARKKYGRGLDLAVLPETAITGEAGEEALAHSVPLAGPVQEVFSEKARQHRCYIVSSTWRHNASIFEPTGKIAAQITPPQRILVEELDLSYAILPWSSKLRNGAALKQAYGDKVGFHYYEDEDLGIFWSNDPGITVGGMVRSLGVLELEEEMAQVRKFYRKASGPRS